MQDQIKETRRAKHLINKQLVYHHLVGEGGAGHVLGHEGGGVLLEHDGGPNAVDLRAAVGVAAGCPVGVIELAGARRKGQREGRACGRNLIKSTFLWLEAVNSSFSIASRKTLDLVKIYTQLCLQ